MNQNFKILFFFHISFSVGLISGYVFLFLALFLHHVSGQSWAQVWYVLPGRAEWSLFDDGALERDLTANLPFFSATSVGSFWKACLKCEFPGFALFFFYYFKTDTKTQQQPINNNGGQQRNRNAFSVFWRKQKNVFSFAGKLRRPFSSLELSTCACDESSSMTPEPYWEGLNYLL